MKKNLKKMLSALLEASDGKLAGGYYLLKQTHTITGGVRGALANNCTGGSCLPSNNCGGVNCGNCVEGCGVKA